MLSDWMIVLVDIGQPIELLGCSMFNYMFKHVFLIKTYSLIGKRVELLETWKTMFNTDY